MRPLWAREARGYAAPAFVPTSLGTSKLRLWLRPEGMKYTTSARSVVESGTGVIGAWDDDSGNALHAVQVTSGLRPSRRTGGGVSFNATRLIAPALGAWGADYVILLAAKTTTHVSYSRFLEVDYTAGVNIMNESAAGDIRSGVAESAGPYGITTPWSAGAVHWLLDKRTGTTHSIAVDGGTAVTNTVTSGALANASMYLGASNLGSSFDLIGDIHELLVVAAPSAGDLTNLAAYMAARATAGVWT